MNGLPNGLAVTLYPQHATWKALREFVRMADALGVPDEANLRCSTDYQGELEGIELGPRDGLNSDGS